MKQKYDVTGMTCSACSSRVEKSVEKLAGVNRVSVNLLTNSMQVDYDEKILAGRDIISCVEKAGYGASVAGGAPAAAKPRENRAQKEMRQMKKRLILSFAFWIPLMYVSMGSMYGAPLPAFLTGMENAVSFAFIQFLLCLPVMYINRHYYEKGFSTLAHGAPNMDSLIAVGSAAAVIYGVFAIFRMSRGLGAGDMELVAKYHMDLYFESCSTILTLITVGKYLEAKSKGKTSQALAHLLDLAPKTAIVEKDGQEVTLLVEQVAAGDTVIVKPGMSIPVDGVVISGESTVDQAAITGESLPVYKGEGDEVIGATINKTGFMKIKATKVGENTTFAQIIKLVEEASASKAPIAKLADKVAGIFVPTVMTISLVTFVAWMILGAEFEFALSCAITVLVISCPCALGLATPVAIMVGTGKGAENGILIKSGEALETAHNVNTVVLDKTGTITRGKPVVTDVWGDDIPALLTAAAALESKSEHPLAGAVMEYVSEKQIQPMDMEEFRAVPGRGVSAVSGGVEYTAGNFKLMEEKGVDISTLKDKAAEFADRGKTPLIFAKGSQPLGIIAVADVIKPTSAAAIDRLRSMGIDVIMLTGDNARTAKGIAKDLNLTDTIADVLPRDKEKVVSDLQRQGKIVAMVGDGVNDAPALVRADVGIAIGAGTDVAVESADIVLMKNDLLDVVNAVRLSKAVIKNIKENLFWAFFYNSCGIPLAAGVFYGVLGWKLTPAFGAAAMSFSSLFVVSNALRLKWFKADTAPSNREKPSAQTPAENNDAVPASCECTATRQEDKAVSCGEEKSKERYNTIIKIDGMMCQHCVNHVTQALKSVSGAENITVDLESGTAALNAAHDMAPRLKKAVEDAGYTVTDIIFEQNDYKENKKMTLKIEGMMCQHCVNHVTKALQAVNGAENVSVDLEKGVATLDAARDMAPRLKKAVEDAGYTVTAIE